MNFNLKSFLSSPWNILGAIIAGVLAGVHEDWNMSKCLLLGVNVAAASLMDASASESILPWQECLKLGEDFDYHMD
jgi:hypothetical protein